MLAGYRQALAGLGRDGRLFLLAAGTAGFSYMGVFLLLANLYLLRLDFDETFIGLFAATGALTAALLGLPAGVLGRRLGPRRGMIVGFCILAAGIGALSLAALLPPAWRAPWLLSCCVVRELGNSLYNVNANPFLMAATEPAHRGRVFAARMALANLAAFVGSGVGGVLPLAWAQLAGGDTDDPRAFMAPLLLAFLGLLPGVAALIATGRARPGAAAYLAAPAHERPGAPELLREPLRQQALEAAARHADHSGPETGSANDPVAPRPAAPGAGTETPLAALTVLPLVGLLYITGVAASVGFFNVLMDRVFGLSSARIGAVLAATQLTTVPVILVMAGGASGRGVARAVGLAALGVTAGVALEAVASTGTLWWVAACGYVLMGTLNGVFFAAMTVYHQEQVHPDWRPLMSGAFMTACALGWALTNWAGGYIIVSHGYPTLFGGAATCALTGTLLFGLYVRRVDG